MRKDILHLFSMGIRKELEQVADEGLNEIRLRTDKPILLMINNQEYFLCEGKAVKERKENSYIVKETDIKETMEYVTNYSLYAFEDELKKGFLTVTGGHRIGICGKVVYEKDEIKTIRNVQSLNVRIAHEIRGCAKGVIPYLEEEGCFKNTLILSKPGMGKTTLLRELVRLISDGRDGVRGHTVGLVDERSEIASCYLGKPQNDIGIRTDVLDCCQKKDGMIMLVRAMRPDVIAVDEIGSIQDCQAIEYASLCGCGILATVHGTSLEEVRRRDGMKRLMDEKIFLRYVLCDKNRDGIRWKKIYDEDYKLAGECFG